MPNALLTPDMITNEALRILHQKCNFIGSINRQYDSSFAKEGAKIGSTLRIRLPAQFTVRNGAVLSAQDMVDEQITLTANTQRGVDMEFSSSELALSIDDFAARYIEPAMNVLAANLESTALTMYRDVYNVVNNVGGAMTFANILNGRKLLVDGLSPTAGLKAILNTKSNVDLVDALKGLFNDTKEVAAQYREGYMGRTAGFDFMENTLMPQHPRGAGAGYLVNGASQTGSTLVVDTGTGALPAGEVFTIAGVFRVHPETKAVTAQLQQFTVTANYAGGAGSVSISPAIVTSGARQTVSGSPADNAAITILGTASTAYDQSLLFHPDAFTFATVDLPRPPNVEFSRKVLDGISMRYVRQYDVRNDTTPARLDVMFGFRTIRPQLAARVATQA